MKRVKKALIAIFVVAICALTLTACGETSLPTNKPIKWTSYLDEVGSLIEKQVQGEDNIVVEITGNSSSRGKYYSIYFGVDFDVKNVENSAMALIVKDKERTVFSLLADEGNTYLDVGQNDVLQTVRLKLNETGLFSWLGAKIDGDATNGAKIIKDVFVNIGQNIFNGVDVDKDRTKYSFMIDEVKFADGILKSIEYILQVDPELSKIFLGILGVNEKDDVASLVQGVDGNVEFNVQDGKIVSVNADCTSENNTSEKVKFSVKVGEEVSNIKDKLPTSDEGYKVTKVGTAMVSGTIGLYSQSSRAISYDYTLNVNLDLMKLIYNDYDLSTLSGDNYFHLRLTHKCSEYCKEFCLSKISRSKGAVVDVAYSPKHFGTNNLYVNVNLQSVMSSGYMQEKAKYFNGMAAETLSEYALFTFTPEVLREKSYISKFFGSMYLNYMGVKQGEFDYSVDKFKQTFSSSDLITLILNDYFVSEEFVIDEIKLRITDNVSWQTDEYDIYKDTVYIIDNEVSELKRYKADVILKSKESNILDYVVEAKTEGVDSGNNEKYLLNNIYDKEGNLLTGVNDNGVYVPIGLSEAQDLVGKTIKLKVIGYDKQVKNDIYLAEIVEVVNIDYENFDSVQEVTLRIKYPNPLEYAYGLGDAVIMLMDNFLEGKGDFTEQINVSIKLTKEVEDSFSLKSADNNEQYEMFYNVNVDKAYMLKGEAELSYQNGYKKTMSVIATSDSVQENNNLLGRAYSTKRWGVISLTFNVAGRKIKRSITIKKPDQFDFSYNEREHIVNTASYLDNYTYLYGIYNHESGTTKSRILVDLENIYINNISLAEETENWGHYDTFGYKQLVFYKSNDYIAEVRVGDYVSHKFVVKVVNKSQQAVEYAFKPKNMVEPAYTTGGVIYLSGSIINEKHGVQQGESILEVRVKMAVVSSSGDVKYVTAKQEDYELTFSVGGVLAENNEICLTLPELIITPIEANIKIKFITQGAYKVEFLINRSEKYVYSFSII
ncbi:MAG: hypothetical protein SPG06_04950 [Eubacteriales bacterium]|nr:hypothetical protein [Eubacteriales bacterium]